MAKGLRGMSNYNAPYGYGPSEPEWVSRILPYFPCLSCDANTHEEDLSEDCYCLDCAPECENCEVRDINYEIWNDVLICFCCYEGIYECEVCDIKTLKEYYDADSNYTCKICYDKNPRDNDE